MTTCALFPYGRFNITSSNLKLFPPVNNKESPDSEKVFGANAMMVRGSDGNFFLLTPYKYRDVITINRSYPGSRVSGNIFKNTAMGFTRKQRISLLSKFKLR